MNVSANQYELPARGSGAPAEVTTRKPARRGGASVPERVEQHDPEGLDYGWVMQVTFVTTILVGAPVVALVAAFVPLPTWGARAGFAIRVGAAVWIVTAVAVYLYARSRQGERG